MVRVSYCGRVGSFSHEASLEMFPNSNQIACNTFLEAIQMAEKNEVDYAIIPIENSTAGRVAEIHNLLPSVQLGISQEKVLEIRHNLYGAFANSTLEEIRVVKSHPQALMQCSKFILQNNLVTEESSNTAISAEELSQKPQRHIGVICSKIAGIEYNLHPIAENIQNNNNNFTTFIALSRKFEAKTLSRPLTSLIFEISNKSGGIYEALGCFAKHGVNLVKLESYIPFGVSQIAKFFITFEGCNKQDSVQKALEELEHIAHEVNNLGSYEADAKRFV